MQGLPQIISLVPQTGLQFIDIRFNLDRLPRAPRSFWEQPLPPGADPASAGLVNLRRLTESGEGALLDPISGRSPPDEEIYQVGRGQALEADAVPRLRLSGALGPRTDLPADGEAPS